MNRDSDTHPLSNFTRTVLGRLLLLTVAVASSLGIVVLMLYRQEREHERSLLAQQGQQRVDQEFEFLKRESQAVRSDVLYLAQQELLARFLSGDVTARQELEREYVRFAIHRTVYDQIRCLDTTGKEVIRVDFRDGHASVISPEELQVKADRYYYQEALRLKVGEVFVSQFDLNVEHGQIQRPLKPVVRFVTPAADREGARRGLLTLNYSGDYLLDRFNELSLPGSTLLVNSQGEYICGPSPADAWGWLLGHERNFPKQFPIAWQRMAKRSEGQFSTSQGIFTFRRVSLAEPHAPLMDGSAKGSVDGIDPLPDPGPAPLVLVGYIPANLQGLVSATLLKRLLLIYAGAMVFLVPLIWYWARSISVRKIQADQIAASEARLRTLSNQLLTAQEAERRRISRDLHDELGQQVTAISLDLQSAARQPDPDRAQALLQHAIGETQHLLGSLHEIAFRVRPSVLDDLGLLDAVESLVEDFQKRSGIDVESTIQLEEARISPRVGENVYRILQEALTNVAKHARAPRVDLALYVEADQLRMTIRDEGVGFDPPRRDASRLGILGMRERTELLGGRFELDAKPGEGTCVEVRIPLLDGEPVESVKMKETRR